MVSVGVGLVAKRLCFYFVLRTRPFARRNAKTQRLCLYIGRQALLCQRIAAYHKGLCKAERMRDLQKSFKAYDALVDFYNASPPHFARKNKGSRPCKANKNEFANGYKHINEIVNFFASCNSSCNCVVKEALRNLDLLN